MGDCARCRRVRREVGDDDALCLGCADGLAIDRAVRREREACARLVRAYGRHNDGWCDTREVAAAIRARGRKGRK